MKMSISVRLRGFRLAVVLLLALTGSMLHVSDARASEDGPVITLNDRCGTALDDFTIEKDAPWLVRYSDTGEYVFANGTPVSTHDLLEIRLTAMSYADRREVSIVLMFTGAGQSCTEAADSVTFTLGNCLGSRGFRELWVNYTNTPDESRLPKDRVLVSARSITAGTRVWDASGMGYWQDGETKAIPVHSSSVDVMNDTVGYHPGTYRVDIFANGNQTSPVATGVVSVPGCLDILNEDTGPPETSAVRPKAAIRWLKQGRLLKVTFDTPPTMSGFTVYRVVASQGTKKMVKRFKMQAGTRGEVRKINTYQLGKGRSRKAVVSVKTASAWTVLQRKTLRTRH